MNKLIAAFFLVFISYNSYSQETLPNISVRSLTREKNQISWKNPYSSCVQLSVQRSYDSLRFFSTIFSAQSPELPQNGFIDNTVAPGVKVYYRIFYVLSEGSYFFTKSKQPTIGSKINIEHNPNKDITEPDLDSVEAKVIHWINIYKRTKDSLITKLDFDFYKKFKDSVKTKTKDTIINIGIDEYLIKPFVPKPVWKPSPYLFTNNNGYTIIQVPEINKHQYKIIFTEENGTEIFTLSSVKEEYLLIDKSNFPHAGWFYFQILQDGKPFDKNKFFIESDL